MAKNNNVKKANEKCACNVQRVLISTIPPSPVKSNDTKNYVLCPRRNMFFDMFAKAKYDF